MSSVESFDGSFMMHSREELMELVCVENVNDSKRTFYDQV